MKTRKLIIVILITISHDHWLPSPQRSRYRNERVAASRLKAKGGKPAIIVWAFNNARFRRVFHQRCSWCSTRKVTTQEMCEE